MCRIAGMVDPFLPVAAIQLQVEEMCQRQWHGGPDDGGLYTNAAHHMVLGNRRLSILDLRPEGHMPMHYADGRYTITYNGEIYNFGSLKQELIALGHRFRSNSDTEVVLAAFAEWNVGSFARLNGMFAFALHDRETGMLYLVRDPVGIKPLYYRLQGKQLSFASEARVFSHHHLRQDPQWPVLLLAYGHLPDNTTIFDEVKTFPKGNYLSYHLPSGEHKFESFSTFKYSDSIKDRSIAIDEIRGKLKDSVHRQLISDAPLGVFLSGGLDSSILAKLASDELGDRMHTFSIFFDDQQFSEKKYQDDLVAQLGCDHNPLMLTQGMFETSFPQILDDMDLPSCDGINTWFISRHAAQHGFKAVLSGLGGDELFGGYPSFRRMRWANWIQQLPDFSLNMLGKSRSSSLRRMVYLQLPGLQGRFLFLRGQYIPSEIAELLGMEEQQVWDIFKHHEMAHCSEIQDARNQASCMEINGYMHDQLLRDSDAMSMKHGLEIRVPFLDHEIISTAFSIEPGIKYTGKYPKQILIDAFVNELPNSIWNRPKMGFTFPFVHWMKNNAFVSALMDQSPQSFQKNWVEFQNGRLHWSKIMTLLLLKKRNIV
jgi:asparagine synthase (glutamine-hydrolysing)